MVNAGYDFFPQDGESKEQYAHRFQEAILAEDWRARFSTHGEAYRLLGKILDDE